jgi:hypothetical protein
LHSADELFIIKPMNSYKNCLSPFSPLNPECWARRNEVARRWRAAQPNTGRTALIAVLARRPR